MTAPLDDLKLKARQQLVDANDAIKDLMDEAFEAGRAFERQRILSAASSPDNAPVASRVLRKKPAKPVKPKKPEPPPVEAGRAPKGSADTAIRSVLTAHPGSTIQQIVERATAKGLPVPSPKTLDNVLRIMKGREEVARVGEGWRLNR